jgi:RHS repeat-associated protein
LSYNTASNRISTAGYGYDANGNLTSQPGQTLGYDIENRLITSTGSFGTEQYAYTPSGQRVYKRRPSGSVIIYLYGIGGELLGTYDSNLTNINRNRYFAGRLRKWDTVAVAMDRLGSVRVRTDVINGQITEVSNYFPFGEEQTATSQKRMKFATYYREDNTGLDYAMHRYYSSLQGRFLTPDPYEGSANPANPQSWNRYAYVLNDPVNYNDPDGLVEANPDWVNRRKDRDAWRNLPGARPMPRVLTPTVTISEYDDVHPRKGVCDESIEKKALRGNR